jgi:hypothetical protein
MFGGDDVRGDQRGTSSSFSRGAALVYRVSGDEARSARAATT